MYNLAPFEELIVWNGFPKQMTWRIGNSLPLKTVTNIAEEPWPALRHKGPWKRSDACLSPDVAAEREAACGGGWLAAGTQ